MFSGGVEMEWVKHWLSMSILAKKKGIITGSYLWQYGFSVQLGSIFPNFKVTEKITQICCSHGWQRRPSLLTGFVTDGELSVFLSRSPGVGGNYVKL